MNASQKFLTSLVAVGFLLDLIFYNKQKAFYDLFYRWWFHLSELDFRAVVRRAINYAITGERYLYGSRLFSVRSTLATILTPTVIAFAAALYFIPEWTMWPTIGQALGLLLVILFNLPVGIVAVFSTRLLLRLLPLAGSMPLAIAFMILNVLIIEVVTLAFWFVEGSAFAAIFIKCYVHGVSVQQTASDLTFLIIAAVGYSNRFLHVALAPMYALTACVFSLLSLHFIGKLCFLVQQFLSWQVEKPKFAAFTAIFAGVAALLHLCILASDVVPVREVYNGLSVFHEAAAQHTSFHGLDVTASIMAADEIPWVKWKLFSNQVADSLDSYGDKLAAGELDLEELSKSFRRSLFRYLGLPNESNIKSIPSPTPSGREGGGSV